MEAGNYLPGTQVLGSNGVDPPSIPVGGGPIGVAFDNSNGYVYVANAGSNNTTVINGATAQVVVPSIQVGTTPYGVAYDSSNGYVYVTNWGSNSVTVINGATNTVVVPSITVQSEPKGVAYDSSNGYVYVADYNSSNVTVINGATNTVVVPSIPVGTYPYALAFDSSNGYVYVANWASNNVTVINGATDTVVVHSITVGSEPIGVAFDSSNGYVYVTNWGSSSVTVINGATDTVVVPSIPVGTWPYGVAVDSWIGCVYVANQRSNNVTVINGVTDKVVVPSIPVGTGPLDLAFDSWNGYVYLTNLESNNVTVINGATASVVVPSIPVQSGPIGVAYDSSNGYVYVANEGSANVTVINGATDTVVVPSIPVGTYPEGVAYDSSNGYVYVTNGGRANVTVINGATDTVVVPSISVGWGPLGVAYDSSNGYVYVTNSNSDNVTVINGVTDTVIVPSIPVGSYPFGVAFDSSNGYVYVANEESDNVTVINGATDKVVVPSIPVGTNPYGVAFDSSNGYVYVANWASNNVTVINGATDTVVVPSIPVGSGPRGVAFDSTNGCVYVANWDLSNVTVINGATDTVAVPSIPVGTGPFGVAFDSSNGYVYVTNYWSDNVTVINGAVFTRPPIWSVTFPESGLPGNTTWYVNITGRVDTSLSAIGPQLSTPLPNGSYTYTVASANKDFGALGDTFKVKGASVSVPVTFMAAYAVTFTESGLPSGTNWSVTLNGVMMNSSTVSIVFSEVNGTYGYTVGAVSGYNANLTGGTLTVNGQTQTVSIGFTPSLVPTYAVTFAESGLPTGTNWWVTLNGNTSSSTDTSIAFYEPSGVYNYTIAASSGSGFAPSLPSGAVAVNGSSTGVSVQFSVAYPATLTANVNVLPHGETWTLTLGGAVVNATGDSSASVLVANGTYPYLLRGPAGYQVTGIPPVGNLTVKGSVVTVNGAPLTTFSFVKGPTGGFLFSRTTLPVGGKWCVTVAAWRSCTTKGTLSLKDLTPATYSYAVTPLPGYTQSAKLNGHSVPLSGGVTLTTTTRNVVLKVKFTAVLYAVAFEQTGLRSTQAWHVKARCLTSKKEGIGCVGMTAGGRGKGSPLTLMLRNGTYAWAVTPIKGYELEVNGIIGWSGTLTVNGAEVTLDLTFVPT